METPDIPCLSRDVRQSWFLEPIYDFTISHELLDPSYGHPVGRQSSSHSAKINASIHAPLSVCKSFMIAGEMLLVPRILLHTLVVFNTLEDDLAKAVEIRHIGHLRVEKMWHQSTSGGLVVDLDCNSVLAGIIQH
jgi:hypothetical protein